MKQISYTCLFMFLHLILMGFHVTIATPVKSGNESNGKICNFGTKSDCERADYDKILTDIVKNTGNLFFI